MLPRLVISSVVLAPTLRVSPAAVSLSVPELEPPLSR